MKQYRVRVGSTQIYKTSYIWAKSQRDANDQAEALAKDFSDKAYIVSLIDW